MPDTTDTPLPKVGSLTVTENDLIFLGLALSLAAACVEGDQGQGSRMLIALTRMDERFPIVRRKLEMRLLRLRASMNGNETLSESTKLVEQLLDVLTELEK